MVNGPIRFGSAGTSGSTAPLPGVVPEHSGPNTVARVTVDTSRGHRW